MPNPHNQEEKMRNSNQTVKNRKLNYRKIATGIIAVILLITMVLSSVSMVFAATPAVTASTNENAGENDTQSNAAENESTASETASETATEPIGDVGDTIEPAESIADNGQGYGTVTFNIAVPDGMVEPCIITFIENDSYQEYYIEAYVANGYRTIKKIPAGTYVITGGGPENDYAGNYTTIGSTTYFTVTSGGQTVVNTSVESRADIVNGNTPQYREPTTESAVETVTESTTEAATESTTEEAQTEQAKPAVSPITAIIGASLIVLALILGGIFLYWSKKQDE